MKIFTILTLLTRSLFAQQILGASPELEIILSKDSIKCNNQVITRNQVNDDYCDCGIDEPGTNACESTFYCFNNHHLPLTIKSSRVNNGICDCCDGTDEYDGKIKCIDSCKEKHGLYLIELKNSEARLLAAANVKKEAAKYAITAKTSFEKEINQIKDSIKIVDGKLDVLKDAETKARVYHDEIVKNSEAKKRADCPQNLEAAIKKIESLKSDIEILIDTISAIKSILPQKSDQLDPESVSETVSETAEPNQLSTSILVKLEEINLNDIKNKANQPLPTPNQDPIPINACVDPSAPVTKCLGESLSSIATLVQTIPSWAVWKKILELVQFNEKDSDSLDSISSKLSTLETEKSSLNTRLNELEVKLKGDFGNNDIFLSVYKKCIDVDTPEYIYEICLFGDIHQKPKSGGSSTLVGKYTRWGGRDAKTVYNKMMFENGQTCWNGPARSVEVDIECGEKEAGLSVSETSKCEYLMKIASPLVCQEVKINDEL